MRILLAFCVSLVLIFSLTAFSQETFTLTTYYPAPFGIYQRLVTNTLGVGDTNASGGIDANDAPDPDVSGQEGQVWIADKLGIGTTSPFQELHIRSTDKVAGYATIILEGEDPVSEVSTGKWMIYATGTATPGYGINVGDFRVSECTDDDCEPANRLHPFTIEKGADSNALYLDANGNVGVGTSSPQAKMDIGGGAFLPSRHAADADISNPVEGAMYYNTTLKTVRVYDGTSWKNLGGGAQFKSGLYRGNGVGWRTINVGFRPHLVMLLPHGQGPEAYSDNLVLKSADWPTSGIMWGSYKWHPRYIKDAEGYDNPIPNPPHDSGGIVLLDNGFRTTFNTFGRPYSWIAISY